MENAKEVHMRKAGMGLLVLFFCCCLILTGCGASSKGEPSLVVYSFKGENEQISISNGVIVLTPNEEIFYGGDLTGKQEALSDVVEYSAAFYAVSGNEQKTLSVSYTHLDDHTAYLAHAAVCGNAADGAGCNVLQFIAEACCRGSAARLIPQQKAAAFCF